VLGFKTNNPFAPGTVASGAGYNWTNLAHEGFGQELAGIARLDRVVGNLDFFFALVII
jgi:hypothetical protein